MNKFMEDNKEKVIKDREFLMWLHERLELVHDENPLVDHMYKLRAVIKAIDPKKTTPINVNHYSLADLKRELLKENSVFNTCFKKG